MLDYLQSRDGRSFLLGITANAAAGVVAVCDLIFFQSDACRVFLVSYVFVERSF